MTRNTKYHKIAGVVSILTRFFPWWKMLSGRFSGYFLGFASKPLSSTSPNSMHVYLIWIHVRFPFIRHSVAFEGPKYTPNSDAKLFRTIQSFHSNIVKSWLHKMLTINKNSKYWNDDIETFNFYISLFAEAFFPCFDLTIVSEIEQANLNNIHRVQLNRKSIFVAAIKCVIHIVYANFNRTSRIECAHTLTTIAHKYWLSTQSQCIVS